ncbi:MAG TPA: hypothetical protein VEC38_09650 [Candidatus Binataceae bacterium]|nr:hypothetical protein [Candidatus Binataceae bacterium]
MIVLAAILFFIVVYRRERALPLFVRLAVVGVAGGIITSYLWLPFLRYEQYLEISPYLQRYKYDSFPALDTLALLFGGNLYDHGRLPVLTLLIALGGAAAMVERARTRKLALALFGVWLLIYFGRATWGKIADLLPMSDGIFMHRFIGGVDFAAVLLIGIGGEWIWSRFSRLGEPWRALAPGAIIVALMIPAFVERYQFYGANTAWMRYAKSSLDSATGLREIVGTLKTLPPGRTYAGLRSTWADKTKIGGLHLYDVLAFNDVDLVAPPYQGLSLNCDMPFFFNENEPADYDLFDARYVVTMDNIPMPSFVKPIKKSGQYVLYGVETSGYGELAKSVAAGVAVSREMLLDRNKAWLTGGGPQAGRFIRWSYRLGSGTLGGVFYPPMPQGGTVSEERIEPGLMRFKVSAPGASVLVIKTTYHPNWRVTIDGRAAEDFMVSPSFIGVRVPAGTHDVQAQYVSGRIKIALLAIGAAVLLGAIIFRRGFERLDDVFSRPTRNQ